MIEITKMGQNPDFAGEVGVLAAYQNQGHGVLVKIGYFIDLPIVFVTPFQKA